jgi:predicted  nucleic acid-binding Zn-ribbon protein
MAEPFDTLMVVQHHDTSLDQLQHRIDTLAERSELAAVTVRTRAVEAELVAVGAQVDDLAARQQALEELIAATAKRRHDIEQRMRSGDAYAGRDLQAMDQEMNQLAERQAHLEDDEVALLEEEEPLDIVLAALQQEQASLADEAARLTVAITEAETAIRASIAAERAVRDSVAEALPVELAARYERLRSHFGGVGAARLVGDRCDGCHLTLSSVEIERFRQLPVDEVAICPQCDRILVH